MRTRGAAADGEWLQAAVASFPVVAAADRSPSSSATVPSLYSRADGGGGDGEGLAVDVASGPQRGDQVPIVLCVYGGLGQKAH